MVLNDLFVNRVSAALEGRIIDVIVSGSIGAVESVRFIRALRRVGAEVQPWLTQGGALFTTETALSWAAARPTRVQFTGDASHIALNDACVIAPASASIIGKVAQGLTDSPALALIASYLGQGKPVIIVANMHNSLMDSPFVAENLQKIGRFCQILEARQEESKQKFPEPSVLADQIAHALNQDRGRKILITMGSTRGPIDAVRYISNYSSGALGSLISEEFFRHGHRVHVVAGPCTVRPKAYSSMADVVTNETMLEAAQEIARSGLDGAIFAASVLDFVPSRQLSGKIRSSDELKVDFVRTPKIIAAIKQPLAFKVGFKLEADSDPKTQEVIVRDYLQKYSLSHLVFNQLKDVSATDHSALIFTSKGGAAVPLNSKAAIAQHLVHEAGRLFDGQPI